MSDEPRRQQWQEALDKGNTVRLARAELRRGIASGMKDVINVVSMPPDYALKMTVHDALMSQHGWGEAKTKQMLYACHISEVRTLGNMTDRQRAELARRLRRRKRS